MVARMPVLIEKAVEVEAVESSGSGPARVSHVAPL